MAFAGKQHPFTSSGLSLREAGCLRRHLRATLRDSKNDLATKVYIGASRFAGASPWTRKRAAFRAIFSHKRSRAFVLLAGERLKWERYDYDYASTQLGGTDHA